MIKYLNYLLVVLLIVNAACSSNEKETPSGLKYKVLKAGNGTTPKKDQIIVFDYLLKDSKDSVWANTFEEGIPAASMIGDSAKLKDEDGMTQMFRSLSKGDSVTTSMPVSQFFKDLVKAPIPPQVDSTRTVTYTVKVQDITALEAYYKSRESQVLQRDAKSIGKYLSENNLTTKQDTSGLQYIIHNTGGGEKPTVDNCVEVKYTGRFLKTGEIFDKSDRIAFPLNGVIAGWKLGIPLLGKGDSATLFIPSKLAYGPQGYAGAIPPDAVLIFNVTLLDVKKEFDQQARSCK
jgi:FKBP-type peptidyl-prolyl cis-trans isomerase